MNGPGAWKTEQRTWTPSVDGPKARWVRARQAEGWTTVRELNRTVDSRTREDAIIFELWRPLPQDPTALTDLQRVILTAAVRLNQQTGLAATGDVRDRAVEMLRVEGRNYYFEGSGPWWGLEEVVRQLIDLELLSYDPGVGVPSSPGQSATTAFSYRLIPTNAGETWVNENYPGR